MPIRLYAKMFSLLLRGKEPVVEIYFKNKKVLDIGAGQGDFLAKDPVNFIGVDINEELMGRAAGRGLTVIKADATKLPFPDKSFEGVYCVNVIEHLTPEQAYRMFLEVFRVLGKNGTFVIGTEYPSKRIWDTFSHVKPYSPRAIRKLISPAHQETFSTLHGFVVQEVLYKGVYFKNKIARFTMWALAVVIPPLRRDYLMILRKTI